MLSPDELRLLYALARDYADGSGAIVDAGCFLGGSSAALLAGLRDRDHKWGGPPLFSYDLFQVEDYTRDTFFAGHGLEIGDSFRRLYDENIAPFNAPHTVREGDIIELGWDGGPIDVFFVDILKTWTINKAVHESFFPSLVPGRSLIVHQDYGWGLLPWLHISTELMWESLRRVDMMPFGTHVFLLERPIDPDVLSLDLERDIDEHERIRLIDRAIDRNVGEARGMVELSKAMLLGTSGRQEEGLALVSAVESGLPANTAIAECARLTRVTLHS